MSPGIAAGQTMAGRLCRSVRPVANTAIHIVDGAGQLRSIGVPGELQIGGVQVARGYC